MNDSRYTVLLRAVRNGHTVDQICRGLNSSVGELREVLLEAYQRRSPAALIAKTTA